MQSALGVDSCRQISVEMKPCIFKTPPHSSICLDSATNDVPSDAERIDVGRKIREGYTRLVNLDNEIERLRGVLDARLAEREQLLKHIEQHRAILSALQTFAPEILQEIFSWTSPSSHVYTIPALNTQSPWNISWVCSQWRACSISLPALWSNIVIHY
ncbi:hypothetical protein B0H11DRAFT_2303812, partial [Mycena galericulata]